MRSGLAKAFGLISLMALGSVAPAEQPGSPPEPALTSVVQEVPETGPEQAPAVRVVDGGIVALYVSPEGRIRFRRGSEDQGMDDGAEQPGGKHVRLHHDGKRLYALWWQKVDKGHKRLYVRVSEDGGKRFGSLVTLNTGVGVLPTYDIVSDGKGRVAVAYHDERKPAYQVYLNRSTDGGKTWLEQDVRLDSDPPVDKNNKPQAPFSVEPQLAFQGDRLIATWKEKHSGRFRTVSRVSDDGGLTWQPAVEVRSDERGFFTSEDLLVHGDQVLLVGYAPRVGLVAHRSSDGGKSWQALGALPGTEQASAVSQIEAVLSGDELLVAYTVEEQKKKSQVHVATLSLAEGQWRPETHRLDRAKDNEDLTKALKPDLMSLGGGTVVAVWEDFRNIRPNIYLDYTTDGGKTWQERPRPLEEPGRYNSERPSLATRNGELLVFFDRFRDDSLRKRDYVYETLSYKPDAGIAGLPTFKPEPSKEEKERRLKERAEQFWKLRAEGKFPETYAYFDPVFRTQTNYPQFVAHQGNIVYDQFEVRDVGSWGNLADVVVKVSFHVPEMEVAGQKFKAESREETMHSEWVWVHDDWYAVFRTTFGNRYLHY